MASSLDLFLAALYRLEEAVGDLVDALEDSLADVNDVFEDDDDE
jgi:hypothetical protein